MTGRRIKHNEGNEGNKVHKSELSVWFWAAVFEEK